MPNEMTAGFLRDATTRALVIGYVAGGEPPVDATFGASLGTPTIAPTPETTSIAMTTEVAVPVDGWLVVAVSWYNPGVTASLSGGGLTWTQDKQQNGTTDANRHFALFSAPAPAGLALATVLTATFSGTAYGRAIFGCHVASVVSTDVTSGARGGTAAWNPGDLDTTGPGILISGAWFDGAGGPATNTPDGTAIEAVDANDGVSVSYTLVYRIVDSAATYSAGGVWSATQNEWLAATVAYKAG